MRARVRQKPNLPHCLLIATSLRVVQVAEGEAHPRLTFQVPSTGSISTGSIYGLKGRSPAPEPSSRGLSSPARCRSHGRAAEKRPPDSTLLETVPHGWAAHGVSAVGGPEDAQMSCDPVEGSAPVARLLMN